MRPFPLKMAVSYSYKQNKPLLRRKFSMRKNLTEVVFILDRSGSMSGLEKDTIGGFNSMIEKQKREAGQALISTVLFNNNSKVLYDRVEVQKIPSMTEDDYSVYGCTALLDAIGGAIHHIGNVHKYARTEDVPEHTVFIIMTDGNFYFLAQILMRLKQPVIFELTQIKLSIINVTAKELH